MLASVLFDNRPHQRPGSPWSDLWTAQVSAGIERTKKEMNLVHPLDSKTWHPKKGSENDFPLFYGLKRSPCLGARWWVQQCGKKARLSAARLGSSNDWKLVQNWVMGLRRAGIYQGICQELTETPKEEPKSIAFPAFYPLCEAGPTWRAIHGVIAVSNCPSKSKRVSSKDLPPQSYNRMRKSCWKPLNKIGGASGHPFMGFKHCLK